MGKAATLALAIALLMATVFGPHTPNVATAQSLPPLSSCSGSFSPAPMQGTYSGPWHSDGDYHFNVFNTDLRLQIVIDGRLSVSVAPDGTISGTATGTVDAPITHDGKKDVSSGTGTISGSLSGVLTPSSALLVLHAPVIDMHWGTFVGGGYTVEKFITMPDYTFSVAGKDCTTASGTIAEQDFPTMAVVADGANQMTYAPGIGPAGGNWNLAATDTAAYVALSSRVDAFIASANSLLAEPVSAGAAETHIAQPLRALITDIQAQPNAARCLLERLASWEASAVPVLMSRARTLFTGAITVSALRTKADALRAAHTIAELCGLAGGTPDDPDYAALLDVLNGPVLQHDWSTVFLTLRELLMLGLPVSPRLTTLLHGLLPQTGGSGQLLDLARMEYAVGDDADAAATYSRTATDALRSTLRKEKPHTKRKPAKKATPRPTPRPTARATSRPATKATPKPTTRPTRTATPRPTVTATARPTPNPTPKPSLAQEMMAGIAAISPVISGPSIQWPAVAGATRYAVIVSRPSGIIWSWAGTSTAATLGDTALANAPDSAGDNPPAFPSTGLSWTVLALDNRGEIVGAAYRRSS